MPVGRNRDRVRRRHPEVVAVGGGGGGAWTPTDEIGKVSVLLMPGDYVVTGTPNVNAVGTWTDSSGNGFDAVIDSTGQQVPTDDGNGNPVYDETNSDVLIISQSLDGDLAEADSGAFLVIALQTDPLEATVANYQNRTMLGGAGATPHLIADDAGLRFGGYDSNVYIENNVAGFMSETATVCAGKWDATGVYVSIDGGNWSAVEPYGNPYVSLDPTALGATTRVGNGFGDGHPWDGTLFLVAIYPDPADLDNAKLAQWKTWADAQSFG